MSGAARINEKMKGCDDPMILSGDHRTDTGSTRLCNLQWIKLVHAKVDRTEL
jgi:hypothetical protein